MQYEFKIQRISPNKPGAAEEILNKLGQQGYHVVYGVQASQDILCLLERTLTQVPVEPLDVPVPAKRGPGRPRKVAEDNA